MKNEGHPACVACLVTGVAVLVEANLVDTCCLVIRRRYTGNAGPTVEYFYHRALVVFWPRSHSLCVAREAGWDVLLDLLGQRLKKAQHAFQQKPVQEAGTAGAAAGTSAAVYMSEALEVLQCAVVWACTQPTATICSECIVEHHPCHLDKDEAIN